MIVNRPFGESALVFGNYSYYARPFARYHRKPQGKSNQRLMMRLAFETRSTRGASSPYRTRCGLFFCPRRAPNIARISRWGKRFCEAGTTRPTPPDSRPVNLSRPLRPVLDPNSRALAPQHGLRLTTPFGAGVRSVDRPQNGISSSNDCSDSDVADTSSRSSVSMNLMALATWLKISRLSS